MLALQPCWQSQVGGSRVLIIRRTFAIGSLPSTKNALNATLPASKGPPQPHGTNGSPSTANGPLAGKSITLKDNIATATHRTTAASSILQTYTSPFPSTVASLLSSAGAHLIGKTNMDEFGMGSHSQSSSHGAVHSPFRRHGKPLSPGGSSGGAAVSVATGESWAALGTDTGGSVRLPAAFMGCVGFKPSYGLVSRWGSCSMLILSILWG